MSAFRNNMRQQLRGVDLRQACLRCDGPVTTRGLTHGWLHSECEKLSEVSANALVAKVEALRAVEAMR